MLTSVLFVVSVMGVALPPASACTYWCMNPVLKDYECCDEGNPWYTGEVEEPVAPVEAEVETVDTKSPVEEVDNAGSSGCRYYCNYNGQVYCCDNGENVLPSDHEDNAGRCPTEEEQSCKVSTTDKKPVGKERITRMFVEKYDQMCASDGYCAEEEKCCVNKCQKKHTCMPSF